MTRPVAPNWPIGDGYEWVVEPDNGPLEWRVVTPDEAATRHCRNSTRRPCPNPPAAALRRGRTRVTYFYCVDHMYGRWVEDGQVVAWFTRAVPT